ncbi:MAG: hypothetical protein AAF621_07460 [Pseudomonadota bacterium]
MVSVLENFNKALDSLEKVSTTGKSSDMVNQLLKWGNLVAYFRKIQPKLGSEKTIEISSRLSSVLSILITDLGMCEDYIPLPELVSVTRTGNRFNPLEADSETALVYFMHKVIECLSIASVKISQRNSAANSSTKSREAETV